MTKPKAKVVIPTKDNVEGNSFVDTTKEEVQSKVKKVTEPKFTIGKVIEN
jgi:hypothetical protein